MSLSIEQQMTVESIKRMFDNAKFGISGHLVVISLTIIMLSPFLSQNMLLMIILVHIFAVSFRYLSFYRYSQLNYSDIKYDNAVKYMYMYRLSMMFSGLAFSIILFIPQSLPIEYYFIILSVLIGMSAGALYTIGEVYSVYLTYLFSTLGVSLFWFTMQDGDVYKITFFMMLTTIFYFAMTSKRYVDAFKEVVLKENRLRKYLFEQLEDQNKILEQKEFLDYITHHDELTELPNKLYFQEILQDIVDKSNEKSQMFAIFFIDIDNFKNINDSLGHEIGDLVLKEVSTRIKGVLPSESTLARWAGDEFTVILEDIKSTQDAADISKKILKILREVFLIEHHTLYMTSSIGISVFPDNTLIADELLKYADNAMHKSKEAGKNNFQFYSNDMTKAAFERVVMETSLRNAISNEEFVVYYQPQIDTINNKLVGMEALVRWNHPTLGIVAPYKFIPLAEETGLIVKIDKLIMEIAMNQFSEWRKSNFNPGVLSLNLAIKHLEDKRYLDTLKDCMNKFSLDSKYIELEVTESDVMKKPDEAIEKLNKIGSLGVKISIDDFGTGHSSLSYLKKLPISKLKIDKSFVDEVPHDSDGKAIVKAIIAMAHSLKLDIIAEGVEYENQKEYLLENGCAKVQGYYYAKPMSAEDMTKFMSSL